MTILLNRPLCGYQSPLRSQPSAEPERNERDIYRSLRPRHVPGPDWEAVYDALLSAVLIRRLDGWIEDHAPRGAA